MFTAEDDRRGCGLPGAVISYGFWQQEYGGGPALGRTLMLNDKPVEVIGVTPASFFGVTVGQSFDVAVPVCSQPVLEARNKLDSSTQWWLSVIGRRDPSWPVERVAAHLGAVSPAIFAATLRPDYPVESIKDYLAMKLTAAPSAAGVSMLRETYFRSAADFAGDLRAGTADYLREPRQPDAGTDQRAGAGDGRAIWRSARGEAG